MPVKQVSMCVGTFSVLPSYTAGKHWLCLYDSSYHIHKLYPCWGTPCTTIYTKWYYRYGGGKTPTVYSTQEALRREYHSTYQLCHR